MRYLLDTCTFLWAITEPSHLSQTALKILKSRSNEILVSAISMWECSVKAKSGKLPIPKPVLAFLLEERTRHGFAPLPLSETALNYLEKLPDFHRDPFDRMLVCQALEGELILLTPDAQIQQYPVKVVW